MCAPDPKRDEFGQKFSQPDGLHILVVGHPARPPRATIGPKTDMPETTEKDGSPPARPRPWSSLWRSPNFLKYIAAGVLNSFALQLITLTVGWQIYELTRDPLDLGLAGLDNPDDTVSQ